MGQDRRLSLHATLQALIGIRRDRKPNVYFQPPSTVRMNYPCIVYSRNDANAVYADNKLYNFTRGYLITVIDEDPDSEIPDKVFQLPMCSFDRHFTVDNLNHDTYKLFY